jgi:hypothetical protein
VRDLLAPRNNWATTLPCAKILAESWGIQCDFSDPKRVSCVKKFVELSKDCRLESSDKRFQVEVFNTVIDKTIGQLKVRSQLLRDTDALFKPTIIMEKNVDDLVQLSNFDELCHQMMLLKLTLGASLADVKTIREFALSSTFSKVITACLLYLTLPVKVTRAESCSKLKIIKTYLQSTLCQGRLRSLGILSTESQRLSDRNIRRN